MKTARQAGLPEERWCGIHIVDQWLMSFSTRVTDAEKRLGWRRIIAINARRSPVNAGQPVSVGVVQGNAGVDSHQRCVVPGLRLATRTPLQGRVDEH